VETPPLLRGLGRIETPALSAVLRRVPRARRQRERACRPGPTSTPDRSHETAQRYGTPPAKPTIAEFIDGRREIRGHGSSDMPVWGKVLREPVPPSVSAGARVGGDLALILDYLETIHQPKNDVYTRMRTGGSSDGACSAGSPMGGLTCRLKFEAPAHQPALGARRGCRLPCICTTDWTYPSFRSLSM
jgi:hypothetical protein